MDHLVVVNSGLKGAPVKWLADKVDGPVFFLDDIPHNINWLGKMRCMCIAFTLSLTRVCKADWQSRRRYCPH